MSSTLSHLPTASWKLASEATQLLGRYPEITREELARLVEIHPKLPMVHLALLASDEQLAPRLEAFEKDCRRRIRTPIRQYATFLIPPAMLGLVMLVAAVR